MAVLESVVVPKNSGRALVVKKGQRLRVVGRTVVDFVAFNLHNLRERFDQIGVSACPQSGRGETVRVEIFDG